MGVGDGVRGFTAPAPISDGLDFSTFDCGKPALNEWLRSRATASEGLSARTYVLTHGERVVGYYCLATGAERREAAPGRLRRNMPDPIPLMLIGRLAVDKQYQRRGLGAALLKDALRRILGVSQTVGARAIVVHAIDEEAVAFYGGFGFKPFPGETRTLFLAIGGIAAALE